MIKLKTFLSCAILVIGTCNLFAQTSYTWSGGIGDWHTGANWTPAGVPENWIRQLLIPERYH